MGMLSRRRSNLTDQVTADDNRSIELDANYADAYNNRGLAHHDKGEYDQAITQYNKAAELDLNYAEPYGNRGLTHKEQGKKAEAMADFEKFIAITDNPQWVEAVRQQIEELNK